MTEFKFDKEPNGTPDGMPPIDERIEVYTQALKDRIENTSLPKLTHSAPGCHATNLELKSGLIRAICANRWADAGLLCMVIWERRKDFERGIRTPRSTDQAKTDMAGHVPTADAHLVNGGEQ